MFWGSSGSSLFMQALYEISFQDESKMIFCTTNDYMQYRSVCLCNGTPVTISMFRVRSDGCCAKFVLFCKDHAYPADELMPLSCKGRYRGVEPSRGDVDDALGK